MQRRELLLASVQALLLSAGPDVSGAAEFQRAPAAGSRISAVATRVGYAALHWSDGATRWMISRLSHSIPYGARNIQLVYGNFAPGPGDFEADGPNPIVISAAVEFPEGRVHPVRFGGRSEVRVLPGQFVVSDPLERVIPPRARCFTRTRVTTDIVPYKWPLTRSASPPAGDWSVTGTDLNAISDDEHLRHKQFRCFGPYNIIGIAEHPGNSCVIMGD